MSNDSRSRLRILFGVLFAVLGLLTLALAPPVNDKGPSEVAMLAVFSVIVTLGIFVCTFVLNDVADPNPAQTAEFTLTILGLGGLLYALLSIPAIEQRGAAPIDPAWDAMTYLWIAPILLTALFDGRGLKGRRVGLAVYCLFTAFFDAAAMVRVVPQHVDLTGTMRMTIVETGPLHLIVGFLVLGLALAARTGTIQFLRRLSITAPRPARWAIFSPVIILTALFPIAFREMTSAEQRRRGRATAETDWEKGEAVIFTTDLQSIRNHRFDVTTGLQFRWKWRDRDYSGAYNRRVGELLAERGIPAWSMKDYLVPDEELRRMLRSDEMEEIEKFPLEVNENISMFRKGTVARWGGSMSSGSDGLSIGTRPGGLLGVTQEVEPAYMCRSADHPHVVFIRSANRWSGAFHESCHLLSSLSSRDVETE